MIREEIQMLAEGRFESGAKNIKKSLENDKTLDKYGLGYNGGDPIYPKNNSTIVSFGIHDNGKVWNLLRKYGIAFVSRPTHSYYLEYNLRSKTFEVICLYYTRDDTSDENGIEDINPKEKTTKLPANFNEEPLIKEIIPFILNKKKIYSDINSQLGHKEYSSANKYAKNHFNY